MKVTSLLYLLLLCFLSSSVMHPVNMTVTDISYKEKRMHMKIKFFADDYQSTLSEFRKSPLDLINSPVGAVAKKSIQEYTAAKFAMYVNGVQVKWVLKSAYLNNDVFYVEYESTSAFDNIKKVKIKDTFMFEGFPEQKNIANINLNGESKVLQFDNGSDEIIKEITFD